MFDPHQLLRSHLQNLKPYASARDDYKGKEGVFLDANENPMGSITAAKWNRYPDPYQVELKQKVAEIKGVDWKHLFLGNGSDEPIDLLYRAFCEPGKDNVIINPPTYGMYQVSADINGVETREVLLTNDFDLDTKGVWGQVDQNTKMIFICSPNNPTGNDVSAEKIEEIVKGFRGIVVIDEAYVDFVERDSWIKRLTEFPNLVVLQTFSKAWGLAALRLGMAYANPAMITILNKIKPPYNISGLTQKTVMDALANHTQKDTMVANIKSAGFALKNELEALPQIEKVYPSDANFFLVKMKGNAKNVYQELISKQVIVRDRSSVVLCDQGLRITIGTQQENDKLLTALNEIL